MTAATTVAAADVAGPAGAPAIVFIHGTRATRAFWTPQIAQLSGAFRTIALDLPGHGARADVPFTLAGAADIVIRAIDEDGDGRAVVVGLSLGGYVAMEVVSRSPERVRGLVLAGATAEPVGLVRLPYLVFAWGLGRFSGPRTDSASRWFFERRFAASIAGPVVAGGFWPLGGAEAVRAVSRERFRPRLAAYPGPTLIINGEWDLPFRLGAASFARAAKHPQRVVLRGASHLSNLERPAAFSAAIERFARSLDEAS